MNHMRAIVLSVLGYVQFGFAVLGFIVFTATLASSCTPAQRAVVRDITDIAEQVCGGAQTPRDCFRLMGAAPALASSSSSAPEPSSAPPVLPPMLPPVMAPPPATCPPVASATPPVASSASTPAASASAPAPSAPKAPPKGKGR